MKYFLAVISIVVLTVTVVQPVAAADVTAAIDFNSAYVFRGKTLNDGWVVQPSVDITKGGFDLNVWGNFDIDDYNDTLDSGEFSQINLTAFYGHTFDWVNLGVGYIEYLFPTTDTGGAPGTREIYFSLGSPLPAGFSMALDVYYDFDEVEDYYSTLMLAWTRDISEQLSLKAGASIAYAGDEYCADNSAGFYDYNLLLTLGYTINEAWRVSAFIKYTDSLDSDNLVDVDDGGVLDVKTYGGVNISYTF